MKKIKIILIFLSFFVINQCQLLFSAGTSCNNYRYVSPDGIDNSTNTCDNASFPCATIQAGIDNATDNGTCIVLLKADNGSYTFYEDNISIDKNNIAIVKSNNETVKPEIICKTGGDNSIFNINLDNESLLDLKLICDNLSSGNNPLINMNSGVHSYKNIHLDNLTILTNGIAIKKAISLTMDNITIENCHFDNSTIKDNISIYLYSVTNSHIWNNVVDNSTTAFYLDKITDTAIVNTTINHSTEKGIYIKNSDNVSIENNTLADDNASYSLWLDNVSNSGINNNANIRSKINAYVLDNVTFDNNTFYETFYVGISNQSSHNVTISDNNFNNTSGDSLHIVGNSTIYHENFTIDNNTFNDPASGSVDYAIYFYKVDRSNIHLNSINNQHGNLNNGIYLKNSSFNLIDNNTFAGRISNGESIRLVSSTLNVISGNSMHSKSIMLDNSSNNTLFKNTTIEDYEGDFPNITFNNNSNYNIIFQNNIGGSIYYGSDSDNNSIYFNYFNQFYDNNSDESYGQDNYWDSPVKIAFEYNYFGENSKAVVKSYIGNYYSDTGALFNSSDNNKDGIADNPFTVDTIGNDDIDHYPMSNTSFDNYTIYAWWLDIDDNNNFSMNRQNLDLKPDNTTIANGNEIIFKANNTGNMNFEAGNASDNRSWTGVLTFNDPVNGNISVSIGVYDNGTYTYYVSDNFSCNGKTVCPFFIDNFSAFSTGNNQLLAFKINNDTGSDINLIVGGGYSFISKPVDKYKATASVNGSGSVKINDETKTEEFFFKNTILKFEGIADSGYMFDHYELDNGSSSTENPDNISASDNFTYTAYFSSSGGSSGGNSGGTTSSGDSGSSSSGESDSDEAEEDINNASSTVDDAIQQINSGGEIDMDTLAENLNKLDAAADQLISSGASEEKLEQALNKVSDTVNKLDQIVNATKNTSDITTLAETLDDTVKAGIKLAANVQNSEEKVKDVVHGMGNVINNAIDKTLEIADKEKLGEAIGTVIEKSGESIKNTLDSLKSIESPDVVQASVEQFQTEVKSISETTVSSLNQLNKNNFNLENSENLINGISNMVAPIAKVTEQGINTEVALQAKEVADKTIDLIADDLTNGLNSNAFSDSDNITELMLKYPEILKKAYNVTTVDLTSGVSVDKDTLKDNISGLLDGYNLTSEEKDNLINALPEVVLSDKYVFQDNSSNVVNTNEIISAQLEDIGVSANNLKVAKTGEIIMNLTDNNSIDFNMSVFVPKIKIVPSKLPDGVHILPDGRILSVKYGVGTLLSPAPANTIGFSGTLYKIFSNNQSDNASIINIDENGIATVKIKDNELISLGFGYLLKDLDSFSTGTVTFNFQGTDPASSAYALLASYSSDNIEQSMPPMVASLDLLIEELDRYLGSSYNIDRNTGIIDLNLDVKYKADFVVTPFDQLSSTEISSYNKNKDDLGVSWEFLDYNNDGMTDVIMYSNIGKQVIYAIKE